MATIRCKGGIVVTNKDYILLFQPVCTELKVSESIHGTAHQS